MRFSNRMRLLAAAALGIVADVFAMGDAYSARMQQAHVAAFAGAPRELFLFTRDGLNPENVCRLLRILAPLPRSTGVARGRTFLLPRAEPG